MKRMAIFLDRDGVLNEMVYDPDHGTMDSPRREDQVFAIKGAGKALARLRDAGYLLVVVTNQPGVAKGTLTIQELDTVHEVLKAQLLGEGGAWDDLVYCPHHPSPARGSNPAYVRVCECRKPGAGMLLEAAKRHDIDLVRSWMVGDGIVDVIAGKRAGCRTVLVSKLKIGMVEKFLDIDGQEPDFVCRDLDEVSSLIIDGVEPSRQREQ